MKITLLVVGKTTDKYSREAISVYYKRLTHYIPFEIIEIPDLKNSKKLSEDQIKAKEAESILEYNKDGNLLVLLDEKGKEFTSVEYSEYIQKKMNSGLKNLIFVVGGPYGFDKSVYLAVRERISLSKMTFSHQMVRVFFVEQIYRSMTILKGEPYHHQ